jgi:HlyD family secretion protein
VQPEQLYPGTPVEAFINTGDRTFFEYLARPMLDSFARAFTER